MRYRLLDAILLLIALTGGFFVWRTSQEQARIRAKIEQMTGTAGDLVVTDRSRIHVLALDTGEPLHFAWRIYLPAGYELVQQGTPAGLVSVSPPTSDPAREVILRVRFREDAEGVLNLYEHDENTSHREAFAGWPLAKILHGRFDKVLVEQLGTPTSASVGVDEPLNLLSLKLPADMEAEILKEMRPAKRANYDPQFFRLSFGPEAKKPPPSGEGEPIP